MDKLIVIFLIGAILGPYLFPLSKAILIFLGVISLIVLYTAYSGADKPDNDDDEEFKL